MALAHRTASEPVALEDRGALEEALSQAPYAFEFFEALRRFECVYRERPRLGKSTRLAEDPIRLAQEPTLRFAPSSLASFTPGEGEQQPGRLGVYCLGLFGPHGPLPLHLTEYARDRLRNADDPTFTRFLDLFHHRMLALFYRAWADAQPTVSYDRPDSDRFALYLGALTGLSTPGSWGHDAMPDRAKLHYAGHLVAQTRNAEGLEALLADFFRQPVTLTQFIGHWLTIPEPIQLGMSPATGALGATTTVGTRVWDRQSKFRLTIGPLDFTDYRRLLPGGDTLEQLRAVVRNYIGLELAWDLNLVLARDWVPRLQLGRVQLGWTTWLTSRPLARDGDDLVLDPVPEEG